MTPKYNPRTKFMEFLSIIEKEHCADLIHFIQMPVHKKQKGNLLKRDIEIAKHLLVFIKNDKKNVTLTEGFIKENFLTKAEQQGQKWSRIKSRILSVWNKYFLFLEIDKISLKDAILYEFYHENNMPIHLRHTANVSSKKRINDDYLPLTEYLLKYIETVYNKQERKSDRVNETEALHKILDDFYLEEKLLLLCEEKNRNNVFNSKNNNRFEQLISLEKLINNQSPIHIVISFYIWKYLNSKDDDNFKILEKLFEENHQKLSESHLHYITLFIMNFFSEKVNKGEEKYAQKYIDCIDILEKRKLYIVNQVSPTSFRNGIMVGLIAKNDDWVKNYFNRNRKHLKKEGKREIVLYCDALINFHQEGGKMKICKNNLLTLITEAERRISTIDYYLKISIDKLQIQVRLNEAINNNFDINFFKSNLENLKKRIRNEKRLIEYKKETMQAFFKLLDDMVYKILKGNPVGISVEKWEKYKNKLTPLDKRWLEGFVEKKRGL